MSPPYPVGIWCQNDVISTSVRNHVASTLTRCHFNVMWPFPWAFSCITWVKLKATSYYPNDHHDIHVECLWIFLWLGCQFSSIHMGLRTDFWNSLFCAGYCSISNRLSNRRKLSFITMHILIRISFFLKAGVAKNPVLELINGVYTSKSQDKI